MIHRAIPRAIPRAMLILALLAGTVLGSIGAGSPAQAASRVSVAGTVSATSATQLRVSGSGFQSIKNGHGGIYVLFGTVRGGWKPSRGGAVGRDYFYVPDSETGNNQGYQKYVAFPGSDTASSANGGVMSGAGGWSTTLNVPGPTFRAYDRDGNVKTIDCRKVTCGVITIGAHGVVNSRNETFTPVSVSATSTTPSSSPSGSPTADDGASGEADQGSSTAPTGKPSFEIDRASAVAGRVLAFAGSGLPARSQVSAVLDDGVTAAGPFLVGDDGRLTGVISLPADLDRGTHELRLYGIEKPPSVRFAVAAATEPVQAADPTEVAASTSTSDRAAILFAVGAGLVLALALARLLLLRRRRSSDGH
ncbi:MAG: hypothetical protein QM714_15795 [Nocardioides sp.]|uniref:hypothetical protein n=1 Tax=Nocardioides sp. TaxID=35761 RepID=UPI0039E6295A